MANNQAWDSKLEGKLEIPFPLLIMTVSNLNSYKRRTLVLLSHHISPRSSWLFSDFCKNIWKDMQLLFSITVHVTHCFLWAGWWVIRKSFNHVIQYMARGLPNSFADWAVDSCGYLWHPVFPVVMETTVRQRKQWIFLSALSTRSLEVTVKVCIMLNCERTSANTELRNSAPLLLNYTHGV